MAKQDGVIKFVGRIDDLVYYKDENEYRVRKRGGPSRLEYKTSPTFQAARDHGKEFGAASRGGKLIRTAFHHLLRTASDRRMDSRLNKLLLQIVKSDPLHARGERTIMGGQTKELLKGFDFNTEGKFRQSFYGMYSATVNKSAGTFTFHAPEFDPKKMLSAPPSATHFRFVCAAAAFDFDKGEFNVAKVESETIAIGSDQAESITLTQRLDANDRPVIMIAGVQFFDETNGRFYQIRDRRFGGLAVVEVDTSIRARATVTKDTENSVQCSRADVGAEKRKNILISVSVAKIFQEGWVNEMHLN